MKDIRFRLPTPIEVRQIVNKIMIKPCLKDSVQSAPVVIVIELVWLRCSFKFRSQ